MALSDIDLLVTSILNKLDATVTDTVAFAHEQLTVGATAVGLTESVYAPDDEEPATVARISVETAGVRVLYHGEDPTSTLGHAIASGDGYDIVGTENIANARLIRSSGNDGEIQVTYERPGTV